MAQAQPAPTASTADAGGPVSLGGLAVAAEAPVGAAALGLAFTASVAGPDMGSRRVEGGIFQD